MPDGAAGGWACGVAQTSALSALDPLEFTDCTT
jgi:hypothetical protein